MFHVGIVVAWAAPLAPFVVYFAGGPWWMQVVAVVALAAIGVGLLALNDAIERGVFDPPLPPEVVECDRLIAEYVSLEAAAAQASEAGDGTELRRLWSEMDAVRDRLEALL